MSFVDVLPIEPVMRDDARAGARSRTAAPIGPARRARRPGTSAAPRRGRRAWPRRSRRRPPTATKRSPGLDAARVDRDAGDLVRPACPSRRPSPRARRAGAVSRGRPRLGSPRARPRGRRTARLTAGDLLPLLVPLARDDDDVACRAPPRRRALDRARGGRGSTSRSPVGAGEDLRGDRRRVLAARVVRRDERRRRRARAAIAPITDASPGRGRRRSRRRRSPGPSASSRAARARSRARRACARSRPRR